MNCHLFYPPPNPTITYTDIVNSNLNAGIRRYVPINPLYKTDTVVFDKFTVVSIPAI